MAFGISITHQANTHEAARTATYWNCPTKPSRRHVHAEIQLYVAGVSARKLNLCRFQKCGREPQPQSPLERIIGAARENTGSCLKRPVESINTDMFHPRLYGYRLFPSNNLYSLALRGYTECAVKNVPINHHGFEFVRGIANGPA